jgi:hypothetical protein
MHDLRITPTIYQITELPGFGPIFAARSVLPRHGLERGSRTRMVGRRPDIPPPYLAPRARLRSGEKRDGRPGRPPPNRLPLRRAGASSLGSAGIEGRGLSPQLYPDVSRRRVFRRTFRLTLHEAFLPPQATPPRKVGRRGGVGLAGHQGRPARRGRGSYFRFNPDLPGARPHGRALVHIRARGPRPSEDLQPSSGRGVRVE